MSFYDFCLSVYRRVMIRIVNRSSRGGRIVKEEYSAMNIDRRKAKERKRVDTRKDKRTCRRGYAIVRNYL